MITVKATSSFRRRGEIVLPGSLLQIPADLLAKLTGLVEIIPTLTTEQAVMKIGATINELNRNGPWPGDLCQIIAPEVMLRIQAANRAVDNAALLTEAEIDIALIEYRAAWTAALAVLRAT